jgi:hypothetical protein
MEPQQRRPRPNLGCSAIGWMDLSIYYIHLPLPIFLTVYHCFASRSIPEFLNSHFEHCIQAPVFIISLLGRFMNKTEDVNSELYRFNVEDHTRTPTRTVHDWLAARLLARQRLKPYNSEILFIRFNSLKYFPLSTNGGEC